MPELINPFYFIGYAESAVTRLKDELTKLPLDPARWAEPDRKFMALLSLEAIKALSSMVGDTSGLTDAEVTELVTRIQSLKK